MTNTQKRLCFTAIILLFVLLQSGILVAQESSQKDESEAVYSMGLPSRNEFYWGPLMVFDQTSKGTKFGGQLYAGLTHYLMSPLFGAGIGLEGYGQAVDGEDVDGGARLVGKVTPIFLQTGVDYAIGAENAAFILSLTLPLRRSGLFGNGSELRLDWLPNRNQTFNVGFQLFFGQPSRGKARPKDDQVPLPKAASTKTSATPDELSPELQQTLAHVAHAAEWLNRFTTPFFDQKEISDEKNQSGFLQKVESFKAHLDLSDALYPDGHTANAEILIYHQMIEQAFTLAVGENQSVSGRHIADQARGIIFEDVLVPYNRLLGRSKKHDSLRGYGEHASTRFLAWLDSQSLSDTQRAAVSSVFESLLTILEDNRKGAKSAWKDSALVWLPLQYGLTPQQYATRDQLNGILEQLAEKPFSHANEVFYVIDELFQPEVARMVFAAEDYHVLWIHDIRGMNAAGKPDSISFRQSVNVYLAALTKNVQEYDLKGKMPAHMIFIDQYFYELTDGKYWLELLQNPLHHRMKLPKGYEDWAQQIQDAQEQLRQAVAASERLQAEAEMYGKDWIKDMVKVHVSVTNRADASFRTGQIIPSIPVIPDDMMRDHRKLSFYDLTELNPGKGEALYSGMGIGEQYAGRTWEDRAMLVRGPAFLSLKDEARALLLQQGFTEDEIPLPLRKLDKPAKMVL